MTAPASTDQAEALLLASENLLEARDLTRALAAFDHAEQSGAAEGRCAAGRWMVHMFAGNFAAALRESDAIRARGGPDPHRFWRGEPIEGKRVIVRCLHGLGDAVQMLRYLPLLRARCSHVIVEVPPRMVELAACFDGMDDIVTWDENAPAEPPPWDVQIEVMELPYLFRTTHADLPVATRYLELPGEEVRVVTEVMGPASAPRVGLVWSASAWDRSRCLPMECLARLTAVPGLEFWNLQGGEQHGLQQNHPALHDVRDAAELGSGMVRLAAVIQQLDLVITVDTLAAHLAGALGRPAWVLLQHAADWRWMHHRSDSPWYPSLQLVRQPLPGDWAALTSMACSALTAWRKTKAA